MILRLINFIFHLILIFPPGFSLVSCQNEFAPESTTGKQIMMNATESITKLGLEIDTAKNHETREKTDEKESVAESNYSISNDSNLKYLESRKYDSQTESGITRSKPFPLIKTRSTEINEIFNATSELNNYEFEREFPANSSEKHISGKSIMNILIEPRSNQPEAEDESSSKRANCSHRTVAAAADDSPAGESSAATGLTDERTLATIPPREPSDQSTSIDGDFELGQVKNQGIVTEDPVEKQIEEAINSMPKLPELVLSDNKTYIKFHKDLEEKLMDEKITEIARQMAEESLRKKYREEKLRQSASMNSVRTEETFTSAASTHSKLEDERVATLRPDSITPSKPPVTISKESQIEKASNRDRIPFFIVATTEAKTNNSESKTYETVTNFPEILKVNKSDQQKREINELIKMKSEISSANGENSIPTKRELLPTKLWHLENSESTKEPTDRTIRYLIYPRNSTLEPRVSIANGLKTKKS